MKFFVNLALNINHYWRLYIYIDLLCYIEIDLGKVSLVSGMRNASAC